MSDDMMAGYLDGFEDDRDELPEQHNYSEAYCHGWRNGRDDRMKKPRAPAAVLRAEAERIKIDALRSRGGA